VSDATPDPRPDGSSVAAAGGDAAPLHPAGAVPGLAVRLAELRRRLPPQARLLAVSKGHPPEQLRAAAALGQRSFGESRLQEAIPKQAALADLPGLDWHFIGRLQANKARGVLRHFGTIHSVDSLELAERLARIAAEEGLHPAIFLQVKLRPDPGKTGLSADELRAIWPRIQALPAVRPVGLMTIAPLDLPLEGRRGLFTECAALAAELGLRELSMGMSGDWPEAVAAGSTWVRIGSGLFGPKGCQG
jgi:pyridoxal phosphate enzyme (YggS family)